MHMISNAELEDFVPIAPTPITFSGESSEFPVVVRVRIREDGRTELIEEFQILLELPFQQPGVVLENTTATIFILDNDGMCMYVCFV